MEDPENAGRNPNIIVAVRVRPETAAEAGSREHHIIVRCLDEKVIIFDPADPNKPAVKGTPYNRTRAKDLKFGFDRVFDPYATQYEVFQHTTKKLIKDVLDGYNCTCFAYGATGAGKTFTMIGNAEHPGVMVLTMQELFATMESMKDEKQYEISISYLEIYNETIRDLLVKNSKPLDLRESAEHGVQVAGLSTHSPKSAEEVLQMLELGNSRRCQSPTQANSQSSRSHAVFQIVVKQRDKAVGTSAEFKIGKLSLIDLAGSERASKTKNKGQQLVEGANINKSLLALGNCINALGQDWHEGKYVPYRNSKLTRLLKDSLGGNSKTVMIANISPSSMSYEDTYNTLNYANRAKNIKTKVQTNVVNVQFHVAEYRNIIENLKRENMELRSKLQAYERGGALAKREDKAAVEEFRTLILRAVQDRISAQKHLEALEAKDMQYAEEKEAKLKLLRQYEKELASIPSTAPMASVLPDAVAQLRKEVDDLVKCQRDNKEARSTLLKRLSRNAEESKQLQSEVAKTEVTDSTRKQLERDLSIHYQELEKLNLYLEIRKHLHTIRVLKQNYERALELIKMQNELLVEHNLCSELISEKYTEALQTPSKLSPKRMKFEVEPPSPFLKNVSPFSTSFETESQTSNGNVGAAESGTSDNDAPPPLSSTLFEEDKENVNEEQMTEIYASAMSRNVSAPPQQPATKSILKKPTSSVIPTFPSRTQPTLSTSTHGAARRIPATPKGSSTLKQPAARRAPTTGSSTPYRNTASATASSLRFRKTPTKFNSTSSATSTYGKSPLHFNGTYGVMSTPPQIGNASSTSALLSRSPSAHRFQTDINSSGSLPRKQVRWLDDSGTV